MKRFQFFILIVMLSLIFLNGCGQKEKYVPFNLLNLEVGKLAKTSNLEINLISVEKTKSYYSNFTKKTEEASSGNTFILIEAEIKNISPEKIFAGADEFYIICDEESYSSKVYIEKDGLILLKELSPNEKIKGKVLFEVPEPGSDLKIQYNLLLSQI